MWIEEWADHSLRDCFQTARKLTAAPYASFSCVDLSPFAHSHIKLSEIFAALHSVLMSHNLCESRCLTGYCLYSVWFQHNSRLFIFHYGAIYKSPPQLRSPKHTAASSSIGALICFLFFFTIKDSLRGALLELAAEGRDGRDLHLCHGVSALCMTAHLCCHYGEKKKQPSRFSRAGALTLPPSVFLYLLTQPSVPWPRAFADLCC